MTSFVKSPINYTGNKYRIFPQLMPYFPKNAGVLVDLFCGGATVGANANCRKVVFVDNNRLVIGLLDYLARCKDIDKFIQTLFKLTDKFGLSCSAVNGYAVYKEKLQDKGTNNGLKEFNSKGFYELRNAYNAMPDKFTADAFNLLYLLIMYGFNNDIRFSQDGRYNLPIGKTDLNKTNINKVRAFNEKMSATEFEFVCTDFDSDLAKNYIEQSNFVYADPPYLITKATYNENGKWDNFAEYRLLGLLDDFLRSGKKFMLSNVLEKKGERNEPLSYWIHKRERKIQIIDIDFHYRSSSYNKKQRDGNEREIIIIPR
ncbi:MAG: DNA adenine methylase [Defluviitaleaceae bacterium]|nr:DNA adenine methylase [Defluviitaleaceae bacterium]